MGFMSPAEGEITHVSDTALMVAACRAHETELEDAFVRDPFAARLAGERGKAILNALPCVWGWRFVRVSSMNCCSKLWRLTRLRPF